MFPTYIKYGNPESLILIAVLLVNIEISLQMVNLELYLKLFSSILLKKNIPLLISLPIS